MAQGLEDAFLGFDATLIQASVLKDLKALAGVEEDEDEGKGRGVTIIKH